MARSEGGRPSSRAAPALYRGRTTERAQPPSGAHRPGAQDSPDTALVVSAVASVRGAAGDALRGAGFRVATAETARDAALRVRRAAPDLVVLDLALPRDGAHALVGELQPPLDATRILALVPPDAHELAVAVLRLGVDGCTADGAVGLPGVARRVLAGHVVLPAELGDHLLADLRASRQVQDGLRPVTSLLTGREWEVLNLLCRERSTADIAAELFITEETVRTHVRTLMGRLHVHTRADAVVWANAERAAMLRSDGHH